MNTIETCSAGTTDMVPDAILDATMNLAVAMGEDESIGAEDVFVSEFPALPAILIENGSSHTYAIVGTSEDLGDFITRLQRQYHRILNAEANARVEASHE
jgi:hypothetical protein